MCSLSFTIFIDWRNNYMNIEEIRDVIRDAILGELKCKSILIDGAWGCGKTFMVKSVIKDLNETDFTKQKIVYQSLYGIKDVAELTACYSFAGKIIYSIGKSITSPFAKLIPIVGEEIKESLDNAIGLFEPKPKQKKRTVFIFDDLERTDESLSYISLLGFFNQLIMRGCTIICISSLSDLSLLDKNNKKHLGYFLEKAFDRIFHINETPEKIITSIFDNNKKMQNCLNQCIGLFKNNVREAIKVNRLLEDVLSHAQEHGYNIEQKFADVQILKAAICAVKSIYHNQIGQNSKNNQDKPNQKITESIEYMLSDESGGLNKTVLINIKKVIDENTFYFLPEERMDLIELIKCFAYVDTHYSYKELADLYPSEPKKKQDNSARQSIYYMGDEDKKNYFERFKSETLAGNKQFDRNYVDALMEILKYTSFDVKEDGLLDYIREKIINNSLTGDKEVLNRLHDYIDFPSESDKKGIAQQLYSDILTNVHVRECAELAKTIKQSLLSNDYSYLIDLIQDIEHIKKPEHIREAFKNMLLENSYFLPDLSKTLTFEQWSYCHRVARFASSSQELVDDFYGHLEQLAREYSGSESAIDKLKALVQHNYDKERFDGYCSFLNGIGIVC